MTVQPYCRKANFYETDQMGVIHHSNYIRWFEEARTDFLEQIGYPYSKINENGIDIAIINFYCECKAMVYFGDTVHIHISISEIKNMKMTVDYKVINAATGEVCTLGKTQHFFYDNNKKAPVSLKKTLPDLYELFESYRSSENDLAMN